MKKIILGFTLCFVFFTITAQQIYKATDAGSKIHFTIKNFGIKTGGDFTGLAGIVKFDTKNLEASYFNVTVQSTSIDTDNGSRDGHLRKAEYFDAATYPQIKIISTKITASTVAGRFYVFANLTIKGVTKPIEFGFSALPQNDGYFFEGQFNINRRDFGVGGNSMSLADKLLVKLAVNAIK